MANQLDQQISEDIKRVAGTQNKDSFPMMSGTVVSVDEDSLTCKVELSVKGENNITEDIMLSTVTMNNNGVILYPVENSNVIVGEVDGIGRWTLLKCSSLVKMAVVIGGVTFTLTAAEAEVKQGEAAVLLKDGQIKLNDGSLGGLIKIEQLVQKINNIENLINNVRTAVTAVVIASSVADGGAVKTALVTGFGEGITPVTAKSDLEDTKVTH